MLAGALYRWVQSVGGAKIAWTKFRFALSNGWEWTKYIFLYGAYAVASQLDKLAFRFQVFKVETRNALRDFAIEGLKQFRDFINGAVRMWNSLAENLNRSFGFLGLNLKIVPEVDDTIFKLQTRQLWDNTQLMVQGAQMNANMANREISLSQRLNGIRAEKAEQAAEIARMQAALNQTEQDTPTEYDAFQGLEGSAADTAGNTGRMADSMEIAAEDLKYLRDIAEREAVNRFTTAEIKLDMTNYNTVNGDRDLDGMVDYIGEKLLEQMAVAAEGVHV